jgi:hypothetical protein
VRELQLQDRIHSLAASGHAKDAIEAILREEGFAFQPWDVLATLGARKSDVPQKHVDRTVTYAPRLAPCPIQPTAAQRADHVVLMPSALAYVAFAFGDRPTAARVVETTKFRLVNGSAEHPALSRTHLRDFIGLLACAQLRGPLVHRGDTNQVVIDVSLPEWHRALCDGAYGGSQCNRLLASLNAMASTPLSLARRRDKDSGFSAADNAPLIHQWERREGVGRRNIRITLGRFWSATFLERERAKPLRWDVLRAQTSHLSRAFYLWADAVLTKRDTAHMALARVCDYAGLRSEGAELVAHRDTRTMARLQWRLARIAQCDGLPLSSGGTLHLHLQRPSQSASASSDQCVLIAKKDELFVPAGRGRRVERVDALPVFRAARDRWRQTPVAFAA